MKVLFDKEAKKSRHKQLALERDTLHDFDTFLNEYFSQQLSSDIDYAQRQGIK